MRFALLLACVASLSACSGGLDLPDPLADEAQQTASLRIPLTATSAQGTVYRLRDVQIEISGAALLRLSDRDGVRGRETLRTDLPAGMYTAFVQPGWRLMERSEAGSERQTEAELLSANPLSLHVNEQGDVTLQLVFTHGSEELKLGTPAPVHVTHTAHSGARADLPNTL